MKLKPQSDLDDIKPFEHGDEGTHNACPEMVEKLGDKVGCCTCNGHECKPTDNHKKIREEYREKFLGNEWVGKAGNLEGSKIDKWILEKLQEQSKEYEDELVRLRTYWKKKLQEVREKTIEEIRRNFVDIAIMGKDDEDAMKGANLYMRTLKYLESLNK